MFKHGPSLHWLFVVWNCKKEKVAISLDYYISQILTRQCHNDWWGQSGAFVFKQQRWNSCENHRENSLTPLLFTICLSVVTAAISSIGQGHVSGSGDTLQHASVTAAVQRHCSVCVLSHGRGLVAGLQNTAAACHQHCRNCTHLQISLQNTPAAAPSVSPTLHCTHFALLQNLQTLVTSAGCTRRYYPPKISSYIPVLSTFIVSGFAQYNYVNGF